MAAVPPVSVADLHHANYVEDRSAAGMGLKFMRPLLAQTAYQAAAFNHSATPMRLKDGKLQLEPEGLQTVARCIRLNDRKREFCRLMCRKDVHGTRPMNEYWTVSSQLRGTIAGLYKLDRVVKEKPAILVRLSELINKFQRAATLLDASQELKCYQLSFAFRLRHERTLPRSAQDRPPTRV